MNGGSLQPYEQAQLMAGMVLVRETKRYPFILMWLTPRGKEQEWP